MPEDLPVVMAEAMVAAFTLAAIVLLLCGWPWRAPRPVRVSAGAVLGLGIGFYSGCLLLRPMPHWPPREDQDRFLLVVFPAALTVELLAAFLHRPRFVVWLLRAVVAAAVARVLLHDSVYLLDLSGPGTAQWTPAVQGVTFASLAAALAVVWTLLHTVAARTPGRAVPVALALTCAGAAIVVFLSGSASGGMLGLPLAASLTGVVAASFALPAGTDVRGAIGPAVVGLFAVLMTGYYFGSLTAGHAVLLFGAPLLCALPELPPLRGTWPRVRAIACVALVAIPVTLALAQAYQSFGKDSGHSPSTGEPSSDDYANYGQ